MMESKLVGWVEPAIPIITICVDDGFRRRLNPSYEVHTRPRVQRAPGVPHALFGREIHQRLGRMARRDRKRAFAIRAHHAPNRHRPRRRAIQYSEASVMESKGRGVLDTRLRGYDDSSAAVLVATAARAY